MYQDNCTSYSWPLFPWGNQIHLLVWLAIQVAIKSSSQAYCAILRVGLQSAIYEGATGRVFSHLAIAARAAFPAA